MGGDDKKTLVLCARESSHARLPHHPPSFGSSGLVLREGQCQVHAVIHSSRCINRTTGSSVVSLRLACLDEGAGEGGGPSGDESKEGMYSSVLFFGYPVTHGFRLDIL